MLHRNSPHTAVEKVIFQIFGSFPLILTKLVSLASTFTTSLPVHTTADPVVKRNMTTLAYTQAYPSCYQIKFFAARWQIFLANVWLSILALVVVLAIYVLVVVVSLALMLMVRPVAHLLLAQFNHYYYDCCPFLLYQIFYYVACVAYYRTQTIQEITSWANDIALPHGEQV